MKATNKTLGRFTHAWLQELNRGIIVHTPRRRDVIRLEQVARFVVATRCVVHQLVPQALAHAGLALGSQLAAQHLIAALTGFACRFAHWFLDPNLVSKDLVPDVRLILAASPLSLGHESTKANGACGVFLDSE